MFKGFKEFILKGNAIDLAVGVVTGVAFTNLVNAIVKDLVTPLIGTFGGNQDFSNISFSINNNQFLIGDLLNSLISFITVTTVIYFFVVIPMNKFNKKLGLNPKANQNEKICPECLSSVPMKAKRCKFCTSKFS